MPRKAGHRIKVSAMVLVMTIGSLTGPAFAQDPDERSWRKACTHDAFSLCPLQAVVADRAGVRDCLLQKLDKVSDACVAVIKAALQQQRAARVADRSKGNDGKLAHH
jgi:hypothetical protein